MIKPNLNKALEKYGEDFEVIRAENVDVKGKSGRVRRVLNPWAMQYLKVSIFSPAIELSEGEIIHDKTRDIYYLIYTLYKNYISTILIAQSANLLLADRLCEIQRLTGTAGEMGGTGQSFASQKTDIRVHLREITADLRAERPALLERASSLLYIQNTETPMILDRVIIDSVNYQLEHIDKTTFQGLYEAQLSLDKR